MLFLLMLLFILQRIISLSFHLSVLIFLLWVAKDILLYPIVWRAFDTGERGNTFSMIGQTGIAAEPLQGTGYVTVRGELWQARVVETDVRIKKGDEVTVCGMEGLTLFVQPLHPPGADQELPGDSAA